MSSPAIPRFDEFVKQPNAVPTFDEFKKGTGAPETAKESSAVGDFAKGAWSKLNPVNMLRGMADTLEGAVKDPSGSAQGFISEVMAHPYSAFVRGVEAAKAGKKEEALAHFASALNPTGFVTEQSEVKARTPGTRAEGIGELAGTGAAAYLQGKGGELGGALKEKAFSAVRGASADKLQAASDIAHMVASPGTAIPKMILQKGARALGDKLGGMAQEKTPPPLPAQPPPLPAQPPALPPPQSIATPPFLPPETAEAATEPAILIPKKPPTATYNREMLPKDPVKQGSAYSRGLIDMLERKQNLSGAQKQLLERLKSEVGPAPATETAAAPEVWGPEQSKALDKSLDNLWKKYEDQGLIGKREPYGDKRFNARWDEGSGEVVDSYQRKPDQMMAAKGEQRGPPANPRLMKPKMFEPSPEMSKALKKPGALEAAEALLNEMKKGRKK